MRRKPLLEKAREEQIALTFNDVRLRTGYSAVMPDDVDLRSFFSRNVPLKIPMVSAAMDTVTGYQMAIAMAKLGGLGIIHKNMAPEEQVRHIHKVKFHLNALITEPICAYEDESIGEILAWLKDKGHQFRSLPILNREERLVGIITGNDFDFCSDPSLIARDVMTSDPLTAQVGTELSQAYALMQSEKKKALPLVEDDGTVAGLYIYSDVRRVQGGMAEMYNLDSEGHLLVGAAIGVGEAELERAQQLVEANADVLVVDTAHGDTEGVLDMVSTLKEQFPETDVVAGNVSVGESARRLVDAGADGVKIGQGPGSICTTRVIAGIGRPQVSAVYDCATTIEGSDVPVCADGGLQHSGDIPIAIAAGASSVMMGSMLAGTDEAPGELLFADGRQWKSYRGMGSVGAMESNKGSRERYGQSDVEQKSQLVPEGVEGRVGYKGHLADVMVQYVGGLRRGMGYVGAADIPELQEKGEFDRITASGFAESRPHDVSITKEPPNYKSR